MRRTSPGSWRLVLRGGGPKPGCSSPTTTSGGRRRSRTWPSPMRRCGSWSPTARCSVPSGTPPCVAAFAPRAFQRRRGDSQGRLSQPFSYAGSRLVEPKQPKRTVGSRGMARTPGCAGDGRRGQSRPRVQAPRGTCCAAGSSWPAGVPRRGRVDRVRVGCPGGAPLLARADGRVGWWWGADATGRRCHRALVTRPGGCARGPTASTELEAGSSGRTATSRAACR